MLPASFYRATDVDNEWICHGHWITWLTITSHRIRELMQLRERFRVKFREEVDRTLLLRFLYLSMQLCASLSDGQSQYLMFMTIGNWDNRTETIILINVRYRVSFRNECKLTHRLIMEPMLQILLRRQYVRVFECFQSSVALLVIFYS